jgi:hypothetical protein
MQVSLSPSLSLVFRSYSLYATLIILGFVGINDELHPGLIILPTVGITTTKRPSLDETQQNAATEKTSTCQC